MKKLIPALILMAGVSGALAQGIVNFANNVLPMGGTNPDRLVRFDDGRALVGTNYVAQLLYGSSADSLQVHTAAPSRFRIPTTSSPGTWTAGTRTLAGVGGVGATVFLRVIAWDAGNDLSRTFQQAQQQGLLWGQSQVFTYLQAFTPPAGAPADTQMLNFMGFSLVPEPSVIGLGLLGAGALFLLRRRKA